MKLYCFPPSPNTWKVRAVAAHLGLPLECEFVDLTKGGSHVPDYLALNPTGRTPTLVDGGFTLWESTAIMQYLASRKPNALWPDDARIRADIMRWQSWQLAHWSKEGCEPLLFERLVKQILKLGPPDAAVVTKGLDCLQQGSRGARRALGEAALSRRQGCDARRFLGCRAAVLRRARGPAACALRQRQGLVCPHLGAALLAGDHAAIHRGRSLSLAPSP